MKKLKKVLSKISSDQRGGVKPLLLSTILLSIFLVLTTIGLIWVYMMYSDWHNNTMSKINVATVVAKQEQREQDNQRFIEEQKKPLLNYKGPSDMGTVEFSYPKTWAAYTDTIQGDTNKLSVYFFPYMVQSVKNNANNFALRVQVTRTPYANVLKQYEGLARKGDVKVSTIAVGKTDSFAGFEGVRIDGQLSKTTNGSTVIFKVRDKTLQVSVDHQKFMKDFNEHILKTLKFTP